MAKNRRKKSKQKSWDWDLILRKAEDEKENFDTIKDFWKFLDVDLKYHIPYKTLYGGIVRHLGKEYFSEGKKEKPPVGTNAQNYSRIVINEVKDTNLKQKLIRGSYPNGNIIWNHDELILLYIKTKINEKLSDDAFRKFIFKKINVKLTQATLYNVKKNNPIYKEYIRFGHEDTVNSLLSELHTTIEDDIRIDNSVKILKMRQLNVINNNIELIEKMIKIRQDEVNKLIEEGKLTPDKIMSEVKKQGLLNTVLEKAVRLLKSIDGIDPYKNKKALLNISQRLGYRLHSELENENIFDVSEEEGIDEFTEKDIEDVLTVFGKKLNEKGDIIDEPNN